MDDERWGRGGRMTAIGFLHAGQYFMLDGRKYRVGHLVNGTDGYVACTDITEDKMVVRRFHVDTSVEELKEKKNE